MLASLNYVASQYIGSHLEMTKQHIPGHQCSTFVHMSVVDTKGPATWEKIHFMKHSLAGRDTISM